MEIDYYRLSSMIIKYEIFGEGSQISTNQKRENSAFSIASDWLKFEKPRKFRTLYSIGSDDHN